MTQHLLTIIFFIFSFSSSSTTTARDTITPTTPLLDNQTLVSASGSFALGFFNPPNSNNRYIGLWYNKISDPEKVWVANRADPLVNSSGTLSITKDGTLTITNQTSGVVWSASNSTAKLTNPIAKLLDNGNLVVTDSGDESNYAWQGFDHPTDTVIAGMKIGVDFIRGINRTITAWTSYNDPAPGIYHAYMDIKGDPEIYFAGDTGTRFWRTGPWDGTHLSGIPDMSTYKGIGFNFVNNKSEVSYSYHVDGQSLITKLIVNSSGSVQRALWLNDSNSWNYFWTVPKETCDQIGTCGNYGLCDTNDSPPCNCLTGFVPKNTVNWNLRDGKDGCVRQHELDCVNGTDGFVVVNNVKVPQSENCTVNLSLSLDQCRQSCLSNCECTAYASADVSDGSGCVLWFGNLFDIRNYATSGQDLYVRLAAIDVPKGKSHSGVVAAIAVSLVAVILLLSCAGCFVWRRKKMKKRKMRLGAMISFNEKSKREQSGELFDLPIYDFETIVAATDYFSSVNKLGEGGFGPVYKGKLENGQDIAVKRLSKTSIQGLEEFKNEVILIAKLQHRNLVRLLGCCIQEDERMLIYEYMPNRSLDAFLFEKGKSTLLDWNTRYKIIVGVARGLLYLHQDSRFRIIHRDLKASNILLDKEMDPKISDFGMARLFGGDETDFNTRKVVGTYGYMSPEYAMDGIFSVKSDVFSFGVLILEIISGKKNRGVYAIAPHINLVSHAWSLWKEGKSLQLVDESMSYSFPTDEVLRCMKLGLLCVQEQPEDRPLMSAVVQMLGSEITTLPQPKQPGFAARRGPFEVESSSSNHDSSCTYSISANNQTLGNEESHQATATPHHLQVRLHPQI